MRRSFLSLALCAGVLMLAGAGCISIGGSSQTSAGPAGMFVSQDRGETWTGVSLLPEADGVKNISTASVYRVFDDPQDPKAMYWASRASGLFYSYDDGRSWMRPAAGPSTGFIYTVTVHPLDKCTVYASNGRQVFRTNDCSRTWQEVYRMTTTDRVSSIAIKPFAPYSLYMVTGEGDFLESNDAGVSWRVTHRFNTRTIDVLADPLEADRIFVATQNKGLWRSQDAGLTWVQIDNPFADIAGGLEYRRVYLHPTIEGLLFYASTYGIHRSEDGAEHWEELSLITPPGSARVYGLTVNPKNPNEIYYTATIGDRSTLYKSIDGGQNWITKKLPSGQIPTVLRSHPEHEDWLYVGFTIPPKN